MQPRRETSAYSSATLKSVHKVFYEIVEIAKQFGFDTCTYSIQMPVPVSRPAVMTFSSLNLSRAYCEPPNRLDPEEIALPQITENQPTEWLPSGTSMLSYESAHDDNTHPYLKLVHVVRDGIGSIGQLTLTRMVRHPDGRDPVANHAAIAWMAQCAHEKIAQVLVPELVPETQVAMTPREKEVLRWTAEGKTSQEIAAILLISERTVKFHINNLVSKLKAVNKTQAAVKAIALGMHL